MTRTVKRNTSGRRGHKTGIFAFLFILGILVFLIVPFTAATASAEGNRLEPRYKYYTSIQIEYGDSLWSIAETYRTGEYADIRAYIDEVMEINHLSSEGLQAGSTLCVPYYSSDFKE